MRLNDKRSGPTFSGWVITPALMKGLNRHFVLAEHASNGGEHTGLIPHDQADVQPAFHTL